MVAERIWKLAEDTCLSLWGSMASAAPKPPLCKGRWPSGARSEGLSVRLPARTDSQLLQQSPSLLRRQPPLVKGAFWCGEMRGDTAAGEGSSGGSRPAPTGAEREYGCGGDLEVR